MDLQMTKIGCVNYARFPKSAHILALTVVTGNSMEDCKVTPYPLVKSESPYNQYTLVPQCRPLALFLIQCVKLNSYQTYCLSYQHPRCHCVHHLRTIVIDKINKFMIQHHSQSVYTFNTTW